MENRSKGACELFKIALRLEEFRRLEDFYNDFDRENAKEDQLKKDKEFREMDDQTLDPYDELNMDNYEKIIPHPTLPVMKTDVFDERVKMIDNIRKEFIEKEKGNVLSNIEPQEKGEKIILVYNQEKDFPITFDLEFFKEGLKKGVEITGCYIEHENIHYDRFEKIIGTRLSY